MSRIDTRNPTSDELKMDTTEMHIAGSVTKLNHIDTTGDGVVFKLPPAESGTRVYDSTGDCRGSGKASLDLRYDTDPKYGDVPTGTEAEILREAVSRAFEGECRNGDLRLGDNGAWVDEPSRGTLTFANGQMTVDDTSGDRAGAYAKQNLTANLLPNTEYIAKFTLVSSTGGVNNFIRLKNTDVVYFPEINAGDSGVYTVRFNSEDGVTDLEIVLYAPAGSGTTVYSNISVQKVTEEVVTHPVDLMMLEYYEEELTGRQEVFECIQSLSTTFGDTDVPTVLSTRPLSYFQQYDGQFPEVTANPDFINDRYRCVVWSDLTDEQKRKVAAYMGEKLFVGENGLLVNGRLRARTIRGGKNGDWANVDSLSYTIESSVGFEYPAPQGAFDADKGFQSTARYVGQRFASLAYGGSVPLGAFSARVHSDNSDVAYKGRCFALVVGTVSRLNSGLYHPSLNSEGCAADVNGKKWYESANAPTTAKDCFIGQVGGAIGQVSGRSDQYEFYDAIYVGQVTDLRMSARKPDYTRLLEDSVRRSVAGETRGKGKVPRIIKGAIEVGDSSGNSYWSNCHLTIDGVGVSLNQGGQGHYDSVNTFLVHSTGLYRARVWSNKYHAGIVKWDGSQWQDGNYTSVLNGEEVVAIPYEAKEYVTDVTSLFYTYQGPSWGTLSGVILDPYFTDVEYDSLPWVDIIGDPERIAATFPDGVVGQWIPQIPDGTVRYNEVEFNRKCGDASPFAVYTGNDGVDWSSGATAVDTVKNTHSSGSVIALNTVRLIQYETLSDFTESDDNRAVVGKLGDVQVSQESSAGRGNRLMPSLVGEIGKRSNDYGAGGNYSMTSWDFNESTTELSDAGSASNVHVPLGTLAPNNNSDAVKALPHLVDINGQLFVQWHATQLVYDEDWGDNSEITIVNGESAKTDLNGATVKVVTHTEIHPVGWATNDSQ